MGKKKPTVEQCKNLVFHNYATKPENVLHKSDVSITVFERFKNGLGKIVIAKNDDGSKYVTTTTWADGACLDPYKCYHQNIIKIINDEGDNTNGITYDIQCDGKTITLNFPNN